MNEGRQALGVDESGIAKFTEAIKELVICAFLVVPDNSSAASVNEAQLHLWAIKVRESLPLLSEIIKKAELFEAIEKWKNVECKAAVLNQCPWAVESGAAALAEQVNKLQKECERLRSLINN